MSAGVFAIAKYASSNTGVNHPIRVQPETIAAAVGATTNAQPAGGVGNPISAQVSRSRRSLGLHARTVTAKSPVEPPEGYSVASVIRIPALTEAFFTACIKGASLSYLGTTWTVIGRANEEVR